MATASLQLIQGDPSTWGVPAEGKTFVGINESGQLCLKENDGTISVIVTSAPSASEQNNTSGTTTITPTQPIASAQVNVGGTARAVPIVIAAAGVAEGAQLEILFTFVAVAGLALTIRNANGGGTILATYESDGGVLSGIWRFVFRGGAWNLFSAQVPAY